MTNKKQKQIIGLLLYILIACFAVYAIKPYYLFSILIVLAVPSMYTWTLLKKSKKKVLLFSLITVLLFAPPVEIASRLADAWDVQSILPRIFGIAPIENLIFAFFNFFWVLSFYEYFIDKDKTKKISKYLKYLIGIFVILSIGVYSLYFYNSRIITMPYAAMAVPVLIVPALIIFSRNFSLLKKTILPTIFFAAVFFIYEIVSLEIGSWWWPGDYILPVMINQKIFPIDDIVIWYLLSTPVLIGGYEFFADDDK